MTTVICTSSHTDDARVASISGALPGAAVARFDPNGLSPAIAMAQALPYYTAVFANQKPSLVIVIGDGPAMLAAALAAYFLQVPLTHLGEDGTDEVALRECIANLAGVNWTFNE